jgi:hypothetical protein
MSVHTDVRDGLSGERVLELPRQLHRELRCVRARRGEALDPPGNGLLLRARERLRLSLRMIQTRTPRRAEAGRGVRIGDQTLSTSCSRSPG